MFRVIGKDKIDKFVKKHHTAESDLINWLKFTENANWGCTNDILKDFKIRTKFPTDKVENKNRIIFKLGQSWRIDTFFRASSKIILIKRIGTHEEYNKWKY